MISSSSAGLSDIASTDLSEAIDLETVIHFGPSIGIDTLYKSQGKIPEIFLRRAGVPETLIEYLPSLITGKATQYYSFFISYSTKDEAFALASLHRPPGTRCPLLVRP